MAAVMTKSQKQLEAIEEEKERRRKDINLDHESILRGLHLEVKEEVSAFLLESSCFLQLASWLIIDFTSSLWLHPRWRMLIKR